MIDSDRLSRLLFVFFSLECVTIHGSCDIIADRHSRCAQKWTLIRDAFFWGLPNCGMLRGVCRYLHLGYGSVLNAGTICGFDIWISKMSLLTKPFGGIPYVQTHPYARYMDDLRNDLLTQDDKIMQHGKQKNNTLTSNQSRDDIHIMRVTIVN